MKTKVYNIIIGGDKLTLIAGPCVIENEKICYQIADTIKKISFDKNIPCIFKASYDKANRTSHKSYRGVGIQKGLKILARVKKIFDLPVLSDVHSVKEIKQASEILDIIQIPALLSRQTDLLIAAGKTGKPVNIKKGQFLAPEDVQFLIDKVKSTGNNKVLITERGTTFGYRNLVSDMRAIPIMQSLGHPIIFDATHSVQLPGGGKGQSSGNRKMIPFLAKAAVAVGVDGVFLEVHPQPDKALCDGSNSLYLKDLSELIETLIQIRKIVV